MGDLPAAGSARAAFFATVYKYKRPDRIGSAVPAARKFCRNATEYRRFLEQQKKELGPLYVGAIWVTPLSLPIK